MRYQITLFFISLLLLAAPVGADTQINTGARCSPSGTCTIGDGNTDAIQLTTDGASLGVDVTANAATLTATTTNTATFTGADAAGASNTIYDTTGAGTVQTGSADVTSATVVTDGGTVTIDGTISTPDDVTAAASETATFGAPNTFLATNTVLNQFIGIPRLNVTHSAAVLPDGSSLAELITPLSATCAPITAGTEDDDTTFFVTTTSSYQYTAQTTAADNDGFDCTVVGPTTGNGTDSIGFWFRSDTALTAATLDVSLLDDAAVEANADMPAITVVDEWQWIEIDFAADCDADCTGIDGFFIQVTTAGAATSEMDATVINIDTGGIWLDTAELAIGDVRVGGVISVASAINADGQVHTTTELTEGTDYIVNYQTGADALVFITNQSANHGWTLEALN